MSDKTFVFTPEGGNSGGSKFDIMALLPGLMGGGGKSLDPNLMACLMNNKDNKDAFGGGAWWIWIILLFFVFGWGGNGFGGFGNRNGGGLPAELNSDAGRELLMNAIQGNGNAIGQLSTSLNCSTQQLQNAICNIQGQIQNVGNQVGLSSQQIINAVQSGNNQLLSQIASCCCDVRNAITTQGYENQLATVNQTNTLTSNSNTQFNILGAKIDAQTQILNDKFCQLEMREMQNTITSLRADKAALEAAAITQAQTANIVNQLKPCPSPAYFVPNPNCCYGNPTVVFNDGGGYNSGCGC